MQRMSYGRSVHLPQLIAILTLLIAILFKSCCQELFGKESLYNDFIERNHTRIHLSDNSGIVSFNLLDPCLENNEVFFTGESHGVAINPKLSFEFLKYFNEKAGVRYYLSELSYSSAFFLNEYLKTGDEEILKKLYRPMKGTFGWNRQEYEKWKGLYEYNRTLPEDRKISVVGIDVEHQFEIALWGLYSLLPDEEPSASIKPTIGKLKEIYKAHGDTNNDVELNDILDLIENIKEGVVQYRGEFEAYLGDSLFDFQMIYENMLNCIEANAGIKGDNMDGFFETRDKYLYKNFVSIYSRLPKGKYYGQFGSKHISRRVMENTDWLASRLDKPGSPVAKKVLSILYIYDDTRFMNKTESGGYVVGNGSNYRSGDDLLEPYLTSDLVLFRLTGKNSPFEKNLSWYSNEKKPEVGVLTDYYQFILYISGGQPTEPLEEPAVEPAEEPADTISESNAQGSTVPVEGDVQESTVPVEDSVQESTTRVGKLQGGKTEQFEQIKKAIDSNSDYIIDFSEDNSGSVEYDLNNDGKNEVLEYSTQTGKNKWDFETIMKCNISIGDFSIEREYSETGEVGGGLSYIAVADVDKRDNFVEFYISDGSLGDRVTNTFYRLTKDGIEELCTIVSEVLAYSGEGQIYFWRGCLFNPSKGEKLDLNSVLVYYDLNKREYTRSDQVIGKIFIAGNRIFVYKTNDDVQWGAPITDDEILQNANGKILKIIDPGEKLTVTQIDEKSAFRISETNGTRVIYYNDNGIKIKTEDGAEGWIGGFHMVWD